MVWNNYINKLRVFWKFELKIGVRNKMGSYYEEEIKKVERGVGSNKGRNWIGGVERKLWTQPTGIHYFTSLGTMNEIPLWFYRCPSGFPFYPPLPSIETQLFTFLFYSTTTLSNINNQLYKNPDACLKINNYIGQIFPISGRRNERTSKENQPLKCASLWRYYIFTSMISKVSTAFGR